MKFITTIIFIFILQINYSQEKGIEYYTNGQSGIEIISRSQKGLVLIVSTYYAKLKLKDAVAKKFYDYYNTNNNISDSIIKIKVDEALVIGKCKIVNKENVTNIGFYYDRIEWDSGLIEEHTKSEEFNIKQSKPIIKPSIPIGKQKKKK
jgi:hypothetical protein